MLIDSSLKFIFAEQNITKNEKYKKKSLLSTKEITINEEAIVKTRLIYPYK